MKVVTVEELKQKMDKGEEVNLVDVREPHEFEEVNIGGRLVPLGKVQTMQVEELEDLKEKEVIVYCRSGRRSMLACQIWIKWVLKTPTTLKVVFLPGSINMECLNNFFTLL